MDMQSVDTGFWASVGGAVAATAGAVRWWYHTRKLRNIDVVDGGVTKSLEFVLREMRTELAARGAENIELRARIRLLEDHNEKQRRELEALRLMAASKIEATEAFLKSQA